MTVDRAGNTLNRARKINLTSTARSFIDSIGGSDRNDFYRFSIGQRSSFSLSLTNLRSNADVQLLDSRGKTIQASAFGGRRTEAIRRDLEAGSYVVRVYPGRGSRSASTKYRLQASASPTPNSNTAPADNAGNSFNSARDISSNSAILSDFINNSDTDDYYRFSLSEVSNISLVVDSLSSDVNVRR